MKCGPQIIRAKHAVNSDAGDDERVQIEAERVEEFGDSAEDVAAVPLEFGGL